MLKRLFPPILGSGLVASLLVLSINFACQKRKEESTTAQKEASGLVEHPVFNKQVGAPIDSALAKHWKRNLMAKLSQNKSMLNATPTTYSVSATALQNLMTQDPAVGICFYFGQDSTGQVYLVA